MTKYSGKTLFLEEQPDGRYTLYNWYHAPIATAELEELVPIIRAWEPPKPLLKTTEAEWNEDLKKYEESLAELLNEDTLHFNLANLE